MAGLMRDLQVAVEYPVYLGGENKAAQHIAANLVFHNRTKHLDVYCHYVHDRIQERFLKTIHVQSKLQVVAVFTKPLPGPHHRLLSSELGLMVLCHNPA